MARGINKAIIVGNLAADPEVKYMPSGGAVTNVSIATNDSYKNKETGERVDTVEYHRAVFFNRLAEIAGEYLKKGSQCYVEGKLKTRKWQDQNGNDRYSTEIVANDLQMLGGRTDGGQGGNAPANNGQNNSPAPNPSSGYDDFDDDIPFN